MWGKEKAMKLIHDTGLIPIIRVESAEIAFKVADAFLAGNVNIIEVTMSVPGAVEVVKKLVEQFGDKVLIGTGTVLDGKMVEKVIRAGSQFIVSPNYSRELIKTAIKHNKPIIPGALTPTEILDAYTIGADAVKVFPCGSVGGAAYLKAIRGPLPQIPLVPTGGVNLETAGPMLDAGAFALGVGGAITDKKAIKEGRFEVITENVRKFLDIVKEYRI
ncbi:MAG: bifunctional 4-hydroxy-2-oxoglutarate aldolase/2-dehydro-3-deoxy-phosphogluconate aldolase [Candidatus Thorarchaeota archaeon]|jgi:2-dehydro-3-deoxyphosphogluconate aldolase/(4S)-4-hydroxy-2-oxoglutarate aldolase|nr:MAG: bifunctional 4-hydroxy-2-oxoglutarate aldolase/2-dehydro-3-deoxy-phosphogluconate aldolase [Candidatus Thorarchaeota archaeon]